MPPFRRRCDDALVKIPSFMTDSNDASNKRNADADKEDAVENRDVIITIITTA